MKNKLLAIFCVLFFVNYCMGQRAFSMDQLKRYIPKKVPKFTLAKYTSILADTSILSTKVVYIKTSSEEERKGYKVVNKTTSYTVMRFFDSGKVFISFPYLSYPSHAEANDFIYGKFGYYIIKNGKIKIELYMDKWDGRMYKFARSVYNGIQFYKLSGTGIGQILKVSRSTDDGFYHKDYINPKYLKNCPFRYGIFKVKAAPGSRSGLAYRGVKSCQPRQPLGLDV